MPEADSCRPRILVIGTGALGCFYSYLLSHSPQKPHITCIARSTHSKLVSKDRQESGSSSASSHAQGLTIQSGKFGEERGWSPDMVLAADQPQTLEHTRSQQYQFVLVTTKAILEENSTAGMIKQYLRPMEPLKSSIGTTQEPVAGPAIVLIQNGIGIEDQVWRQLVQQDAQGCRYAHTVISAVAWIGVNLKDDVVEHGGLEMLEFGPYPSIAPGQDSPSSLQTFQELWESAGGACKVHSQDIQPVRWSKVLWNAAWGGLSCLSRRPTADLLRDPGMSVPVVRRTMMEIWLVARASGVPLPIDAVDRAISVTWSPPPSAAAGTKNSQSQGSQSNLSSSFKPSILLDLEAQKPMELAAIVGHVVALARKHNVQTPRLDLMLAALWPAQVDALGVTGEEAATMGQHMRPEGLPVGT